MLYGISYIFIIPPLIVLAIALTLFISESIKGNYKVAFASLLRGLIYGGLILFVMLFLWSALYFSGKGH